MIKIELSAFKKLPMKSLTLKRS